MTHCEQCQRLRTRLYETEAKLARVERELAVANARLRAKEDIDEMANRLISRLTGEGEKVSLPSGAQGGDRLSIAAMRQYVVPNNPEKEIYEPDV